MNIYCESQAFCDRCLTNIVWRLRMQLPDICPREKTSVKIKCHGCKEYKTVCRLQYPQSKGACTTKLNKMIKGFLLWLKDGKCPLGKF